MTNPYSDDVGSLYELWLRELGLCENFKISATLTLLPEARVAALYYKRLMKRMGLRCAFKQMAEVLVYTGPRGEVNRTINNTTSSLIFSDRNNHRKAAYFADNYGYSLLEHTPLGMAIDYFRRTVRNGKAEKSSLFKALKNDLSAKHIKSADGFETLVQTQIDIVMGFVSAAYIFSSSGNIDTLVCGASPRKVFCVFELPALMANDKITSVNGVPKEEFKNIYDSKAKDADYLTYRMIYQSEIDRLGILARTKGKKSHEWKIWKEQKQLFYVDDKQHQFVDVCKEILNQRKRFFTKDRDLPRRSINLTIPTM